MPPVYASPLQPVKHSQPEPGTPCGRGGEAQELLPAPALGKVVPPQHTERPALTYPRASIMSDPKDETLGNTSSADLAMSDEAKLAQMGYKQELKRSLSGFHNFAISFTVVSILTGLTSLYGTGFAYGGPVAIIWGWVITSTMTLMVALSMAEICSAYPTSGALYFWSAKLAGPAYAPLASWITGWFNLLGQMAVTAGIDFGLATFLSTIITLSTGTRTDESAFVATNGQLLGIYAAVLFAHGLLNTFAVRILAFLNGISVIWHVVGTAAFVIALPAVAPSHQSAKYVFSHFNHNPDSGIDNSFYIFILGLLMSQFTLTGYDASGHLSEETRNAATTAARGIVLTVMVSFLVGLAYLISITFSIQDPDNLFNPDSATGGSYAFAQVVWDAFYARYNTGTGGIVLMGIPLIGQFFCGAASITSNSRMLYAFSRDGAVPGSRWWHSINSFTKTPIYAVWASVVVAFLLGLPVLNSTVVFAAVTSIATIGLYISYVVPIVLRITVARKTFQRGPLHLGRFSLIVGWLATFWVAFITVVFVLPTVYPVTKDTLNYASVAVGVVLVFSVGWWVVDARRWFKGPIKQVDSDDSAYAGNKHVPGEDPITALGKNFPVVV